MLRVSYAVRTEPQPAGPVWQPPVLPRAASRGSSSGGRPSPTNDSPTDALDGLVWQPPVLPHARSRPTALHASDDGQGDGQADGQAEEQADAKGTT